MSLFGLNTNYKDASLVAIPVPWEVTTSYGSGASLGPQAILNASPQLDLYTYDKTNSHKKDPFHLLPIDTFIQNKNDEFKKIAQNVIKYMEQNGTPDKSTTHLQKEINQQSEIINEWVYQKAQSILADKKIPCVIGGDHSSPFGLIQAISEAQNRFDILHIDAHLDLRDSYQGFNHSHASIMHNVLQLNKPPENIISVGIRDYCAEEMNLVKGKNLTCFTDEDIQNKIYAGSSFNKIIEMIIQSIKNPVYISFDIDGLEPRFCPNTGTPVPGGLTFNQARALLKSVGEHHKVISFDLCEVAPSKNTIDQWDGNIGARILFNLYKTIFT